MDQDGIQDGVTAAGQEDAGVPEQMRVRLDKRQRLLDEGVDPYPVGFPRTATIASSSMARDKNSRSRRWLPACANSAPGARRRPTSAAL